jgi:streptogramin lyase
MRGLTIAAAAIWVIGFWGCNSHQLSSAPGNTGAELPGVMKQGSGLNPWIKQKGKAPINWTQVTTKPPISTYYTDIVSGPDTNQWFIDYYSKSIVKVVPSSLKMTSFKIGVSGFSLVVGSDHKFYVFNSTGVELVTTAGAHTHAAFPSDDSHPQFAGQALGPDGNVWFVEYKHIAEIAPSGAITEYAYPSGDTANSNGYVAVGPDGMMWFTEYDRGIVGKIDVSTKSITEYHMPSNCTHPYAIVAGFDGNLWMNCNESGFGFITTDGAPTVVLSNEWGMTYTRHFTTDQNGNIWYPASVENAVGELLIRQNGITIYVPPPSYYPISTDNINFGTDGNIWAATDNHLIDAYIVQTISVNPRSITFTAPAQTTNVKVIESNTPAWTASSSAPSICSVAQGSPSNMFVVTDNGAGTATITFSDAIGNNVGLKCHGV